MAFAVDNSADMFALTNAHTIRRVDGLSGDTKWTWMSEDQRYVNQTGVRPIKLLMRFICSSSVLFCKIVTTEATIYVVGLTKSFKGYTLHVVALDSSTGASISSVDVSSTVKKPSDFIALTSSQTPQPTLTWLEDGYIQSAVLTPELKLKARTIHGERYKELRDVGIADAGLVLALKPDETSHVIRVDKGTQGVQKVWEFANSVGSLFTIHSHISEQGL